MKKRLQKILNFRKKSPEEELRRCCEVRGSIDIDGYPIVQKWYATSKLIIEDGCVLINKAENNLAILHECRFVLQSESALIHIGENCGISGVTILCAKKVVLGKNVALGANVTILDNDVHPLNPFLRKNANDNDKYTKCNEVYIDDNVWVGAHSIILKGVHIGRGAVIGAGSVVTQDIPPLTIFAGNPAKYIKDIEISNEQYVQLFNEYRNT